MVPNLLQAQVAAEPEVWFVCLLGIGVVFLGLIVLVGIVSLQNLIFSKFSKKQADNSTPVSAAQAPVPANDQIQNRQEIIAAVCAAIAEEEGTDISAIRVISFKKI